MWSTLHCYSMQCKAIQHFEQRMHGSQILPSASATKFVAQAPPKYSVCGWGWHIWDWNMELPRCGSSDSNSKEEEKLLALFCTFALYIHMHVWLVGLLLGPYAILTNHFCHTSPGFLSNPLVAVRLWSRLPNARKTSHTLNKLASVLFSTSLQRFHWSNAMSSKVLQRSNRTVVYPRILLHCDAMLCNFTYTHGSQIMQCVASHCNVCLTTYCVPAFRLENGHYHHFSVLFLVSAVIDNKRPLNRWWLLPRDTNIISRLQNVRGTVPTREPVELIHVLCRPALPHVLHHNLANCPLLP